MDTITELKRRIAELEEECSQWAHLAIDILKWDGPCPGDEDWEAV